MKLNVNINPSLLNKHAKPVSSVLMNMPLKFINLDDVQIDELVDQYSVIYDADLGKFTLAPVGGFYSSGGGTTYEGQPGDTLYYSFDTAEEWIATDNLYNDGTNIGINNTSPQERLDVEGNIKLSDYFIFSSSSEPSIVPEDESYLYLTSEPFYKYGYSKAVVLKTKLETGEEVIISSTLVQA